MGSASNSKRLASSVLLLKVHTNRNINRLFMSNLKKIDEHKCCVLYWFNSVLDDFGFVGTEDGNCHILSNIRVLG